ncbi:MAG: UvrD-helicase domain-containing protein [Acidithiobacillaceae bacterium]|nr:UvrD-helicase domain-containing protein [Acidithiobacillaceae bacterium]
MKILKRFFAWVIREHIGDKEQAAHQAGYQEASSKIGKQLEDSRNVITSLQEQLERLENERTWTIRDDRVVPHVTADTSVYGPKRLPVTAELQQKMRNDVADLVRQHELSMPTDEQWAMILNDHPATCVVAGAGSGKSTTLILRVIFLTCYLGIPFSKMTVVSFTRKSCKELRDKLIEKLTLAPWNGCLKASERQSLGDLSQEVVRTFHSSLNRMAKKLFPHVQWFDLIDKNTNEEDEIDNPVGMVKLSDAQVELLKDAYITCYQQNQDFRKHVHEMMRIEADKSAYGSSGKDDDVEKAKRNSLSRAQKRDYDLVNRVNYLFAEVAKKWQIAWPPEGVDITPIRLENVEIPYNFYANGIILKTKRPILLSLNGMFNKKWPIAKENEMIGDGDDAFPILAAMSVRRRIMKTYYSGNAMDIRGTDDIRRLSIELLRETATLSAPRFQLQLDGEKSPTDVLQAFYDQGSFIENLGVEVPYLVGKVEFKYGSLEYHFSSALALFWKEFEQQLQKKKIMTFNRAFILLSNSDDDKFRKISPSVLEPFTHLLIDEFQDISPQIVGWLKRIQSYISARNGNPTIEAIGDDWQSIYGWRGSTPQIFMDFQGHFPVHPSLNGNNRLMMMTNFRSVDSIVSDAEKILDPIQLKFEKKATCFKKAESGDHGVILKVANASENNGMNMIVEEIINQIKLTSNKKKLDKNHVLVLARTNQVMNDIKASVEKALGKTFHKDSAIQFMTYHQAKGLQGEVAVLCEDCFYEETHTLRNEIYRVSGLFSHIYTYDQAMEDEAYRLGYVGVTRGIRRVFWFVKELKGASRFFV